MQAIRKQDPHRTRFIIIDKDSKLRNTFRIMARNAQDDQRVSVVDPPYEDVELTLDPTESRPISASFNDAPQLSYGDMLRNSEALKTFRGTLIDGTLQPNVRLGNGLHLSLKPQIKKPWLAEKKQAQTPKAKRSREAAGLPPNAPARHLHSLDVQSPTGPPLPSNVHKPKPSRQAPPQERDVELREAQLAQRERELIQLQQELLRQTLRIQSTLPRQDRHPRFSPHHDSNANKHRTREPTEARIHSEYDTTAADIEAKKEALAQKEMISKYKRKVWLLEQKLARVQSTGRSQSRRAARRYGTEVQEHNAQHSPDYPSGKGNVPDAQHDYDDVPVAFDLDHASPTEALETLRSRIRLPTRRTMRSRRNPR
ncbi:hypothetical protein AG0111_0g4474 [Alternaria gaisen]|uniref:Uncharacterized protein n=1 Tax=Alternaria gaisen TaxID=167740 RepID=A0ACB6FTT7_9PLEO|nr:hypothetical protein AG0111_0g4474 [Alternaria gaisen]